MSKYGKEDYYIGCYCGNSSRDYDYVKGPWSCGEDCTPETKEKRQREWFEQSKQRKIEEHLGAIKAVQDALSKLYYLQEAPDSWWRYTPINAIKDAEENE